MSNLIELAVMTDTESRGYNLQQILSLLMEANHVTLTALHKNTGVPLATLKRLQSDPSANPTISTLIPIANFFNINVNQLIGLEPLVERNTGYKLNIKNWSKIPLIGWEDVLNWPASNVEEKYFILSDLDAGPNTYALEVEEDDWANFMKKSILIIDPDLKPEHKDYVVVYKKGTARPAMKQLFIDEDRLYLKPLNLDVKPTLIDDNYQFLGVLIQVKMDIKESL